jgi:hypothetical protein
MSDALVMIVIHNLNIDRFDLLTVTGRRRRRRRVLLDCMQGAAD